MVQRYRQEQSYYISLAALHAQGSKEQQETFDAYRKAMYPYIEATGKRQRDRTQEILEEMFRMGPLVIRPLSEKETYEVSDD